jgi:hypothetical protein
MKSAQLSNSDSATNSSGLCDCTIEPGPMITVGMSATLTNNPASVPNETLALGRSAAA